MHFICIAFSRRELTAYRARHNFARVFRRPEIQYGEGEPVVIPTKFTEDVRAVARIAAPRLRDPADCLVYALLPLTQCRHMKPPEES
jgi:hypothetical protein